MVVGTSDKAKKNKQLSGMSHQIAAERDDEGKEGTCRIEKTCSETRVVPRVKDGERDAVL